MCNIKIWLLYTLQTWTLRLLCHHVCSTVHGLPLSNEPTVIQSTVQSLHPLLKNTFNSHLSVSYYQIMHSLNLPSNTRPPPSHNPHTHTTMMILSCQYEMKVMSGGVSIVGLQQTQWRPLSALAALRILTRAVRQIPFNAHILECIVSPLARGNHGQQNRTQQNSNYRKMLYWKKIAIQKAAKSKDTLWALVGVATCLQCTLAWTVTFWPRGKSWRNQNAMMRKLLMRSQLITVATMLFIWEWHAINDYNWSPCAWFCCCTVSQ